MKTYKRLYAKIVDWDNLLPAYRKASRGKLKKDSVAVFRLHLEEELLKLQQELATEKYRPGPYRSFLIHDPKERMISAAPFRDRVVHHALCNVIEPIFERTFIHDSYANRKGKGTHRAIERFQHYARRYPYVLKSDIRKFFPSLDHAILKQEIRWKIACPQTLTLIDTIIDGSNEQEPHVHYFPGDDLFAPYHRRRGLPIGNLTSQFWANVYMNRFDHFVKQRLRLPYIRYVDDFVAFARSPAELLEAKQAMQAYLDALRLLMHPHKTHVYRVDKGVPFLGFTVYPTKRRVQKDKTKRYRRFLRKKLHLRAKGQLSPQQMEDGLNSWLGHVRFGHSRYLESRTFNYLRGEGVGLFKHPGGSWRVLEQQS